MDKKFIFGLFIFALIIMISFGSASEILTKNNTNAKKENGNLILRDSGNQTLFIVPNITGGSETRFGLIYYSRMQVLRSTGDENSFIIIKNISFGNETKTVYLPKKKSDSNSVCFSDSEVGSLSELEQSCSVLACPGVNFGHTCEVSGGNFIVSGLKNSGVMEYSTSSPPNNGGGGNNNDGNGGGSSGSGGRRTISNVTRSGGGQPDITSDEEEVTQILEGTGEKDNKGLIYTIAGVFLGLLIIAIVISLVWFFKKRKSSSIGSGLPQEGLAMPYKDTIGEIDNLLQQAESQMNAGNKDAASQIYQKMVELYKTLPAGNKEASYVYSKIMSVYDKLNSV